LKPELTELKQKAKSAGIVFSAHRKADDVYYEIIEKLKDKATDFAVMRCNRSSLYGYKYLKKLLKILKNWPKTSAKNRAK